MKLNHNRSFFQLLYYQSMKHFMLQIYIYVDYIYMYMYFYIHYIYIYVYNEYTNVYFFLISKISFNNSQIHNFDEISYHIIYVYWKV